MDNGNKYIIMKYRLKNTFNRKTFIRHKSRILKDSAYQLIKEMNDEDLIKFFNLEIIDPQLNPDWDDVEETRMLMFNNSLVVRCEINIKQDEKID